MDERAILALAPSPETFSEADGLARGRSLHTLVKTADGAIGGLCAGSGAKPYELGIDLSGAEPLITCNCPSRKRPCKHSLALLLAHVRGVAFDEGTLPAGAAEKLSKQKSTAEKKAKPAAEKKPRTVNKAAEEKKAKAQLEGLDAAEKVLRAIATSGLGAYDGKNAAQLRERAKELADFHLPGLALGLRRLSITLEAEGDADTKAPACARQLVRLWTMVKKGRAVLGQKLDGEETTQSEADAFVEELLGKVWQLAELREKGFVAKELKLFELAYARDDDAAREERVESSWLLDLASGDIHREIAYVPEKRIGKTTPKPAWTGVLEVGEAAVYPGAGNRRIRWDEGAAKESVATNADRAAVAAKAVPVKEAVAAFATQLKNLLAPDERVVLLQAAKVGKAGDDLVLEDPAGGRIRFARDQRSRDAAQVLDLTGWPTDATALAGTLVADFQTHEIVVRPLTAIGPSAVLRLSI